MGQLLHDSGSGHSARTLNDPKSHDTGRAWFRGKGGGAGKGEVQTFLRWQEVGRGLSWKKKNKTKKRGKKKKTHVFVKGAGRICSLTSTEANRPIRDGDE